MVEEQLGQAAQAEEAIRRYIARTPNDLAGYEVLAQLHSANAAPISPRKRSPGSASSGQGDAETYDLLGRAYAATGRSEIR